VNNEPENWNVNGNGTQAEQALRASELSYRRLFEAAQDGILILDVNTGRITDVNPFLTQLLGFSREEMVGKTVGELSPFKDVVSNQAMLERLQMDGYVRYHDQPLETRDGRKIAVEFVSNVYQAGDKQVIQCNIRDITAHKKVENAAIRLAAIIEFSDDAIIGMDLAGTIQSWNRGAEKLLGYTADEMMGTSIIRLIPANREVEENQILEKIRHDESMRNIEMVWPAKDGQRIDVSLTVSPIKDSTGKIVGASKVARDITGRRKLEAQFIEAQKMEVVGQLAAGVAHDFNNILSVIMGYDNLIESDLEPDSPLRKYTEEIQRSAERATGLTQQLLIFSRKQTVQPIVLDLNDAVKDLDKMMRRLIDEHVEMTIIPGKQIGRIRADAGYIGQVLMNLVVNARDAMPGGGKLTIATSNVTLDENYARIHKGVVPGDYVMLGVSDTGTGMTDEVKARMFEAFYTTKPAGKGTGLGLATCQTIVQQSGGHIDVESGVGQGTTFRIYFPRVNQPLNPETQFIQAGPLPRGTETLLVVEDEPSVRHLAAGVLEAQGYQVLRANNGQDALHVAGEHKGSPIRLVITDVVMPLMGGKAMGEWLKITHPDLKILFTSGYTDDAIARHGMIEPGVAFQPKPYTPEILVRKVRAMLDNHADSTFLRKHSVTINEIPPGSASTS